MSGGGSLPQRCWRVGGGDPAEKRAEIEAAGEAEGITIVAVPTELAPEVRALIARKQSA